MKIVIACDHHGYNFKRNNLLGFLSEIGHETIDCGTDSSEPVDYPDFAAKAVYKILMAEADRAILICSTGIGMCMAANRFSQIRAALGFNKTSSRLSREHNDANVLCLGAKIIPSDKLLQIVEIWLNTEFSPKQWCLNRLLKTELIKPEIYSSPIIGSNLLENIVSDFQAQIANLNGECEYLRHQKTYWVNLASQAAKDKREFVRTVCMQDMRKYNLIITDELNIESAFNDKIAGLESRIKILKHMLAIASNYK
jgi:ribose 5-phosphate isomerase B